MLNVTTDSSALLALGVLSEAGGPQDVERLWHAAEAEALTLYTRFGMWWSDVAGSFRRGLDRLVAAGYADRLPDGRYEITAAGLDALQGIEIFS